MWPIVCTLIFTFALGFINNAGIVVGEAVKNYDGYKTYKLTIDTNDKIKFVKRFDELDGYDVWSLDNRQNYALIMVEPKHQYHFERLIKEKNIKYEITHNNVGRLIKEDTINNNQEKSKLEFRSFIEEPESTEYAFDHFPRFDEIVNFMENLVLNRTYSRLILVGNSSEGRPIYGIEIKKHDDNPVFLIDGGIHAREWPSHIAAMRIARNVVENEYAFAQGMTLVIIPCVNPDGYEYTHTHDRLWRKSRSRQINNDCMGVDLNRNFDSHWGEFRSERNSCQHTYAGIAPFSEPESRALRDVIFYYKPVAYLTLHSFGSFLLYPWGFTKTPPPNHEILHSIANEVAQKLRQKNGTNYTIGSAAVVLYEASGASDDWAMEKGNVTFVYTMELPAYSDRHFIMPEDKIPEMANETFMAFVVMFNNIYKAIMKPLGTKVFEPTPC